MSQLNRRDFLKALGLGGATTLSACGLDDNRYKTPVETLLPYVVKPEQVTPGTYTFFATSVLRGPHAWPVTARHRDGRVTFISANFRAPVRPAVPGAALLELQKHYSPDRWTGPMAGGAASDWDTALGQVASAVKAAKAAGKKVAYLGGYKSGAIVELLEAFTEGNALFWESNGYEAEVVAAEGLFGRRVVPHFHLDRAEYLLSFGAPFLSGWGGAKAAQDYATARDPNVDHSVVRFALVSPHRDQTGVNADDWYGVKPGSEVLVARAVARKVADAKGAPAAVKQAIGDVTVAQAAEASGLDAAAIEAIAENFGAHKGLALPGGVTGSADLAAAVYLLNLASGDPLFDLGGYAGPVHGASDLAALVADMQAGNVGVLLVDDANPVYAHPDGAAFASALGQVGTVVAVASHPDETTSLAKLVLPTSDALEDWGDEEPWQGMAVLRQPAMSPLYDSRSLGDVLLAVARAAGLGSDVGTVAAVADEGAQGGTPTDAMGEPVVAPGPVTLGFRPETWREYVAETWKQKLSGDFVEAWEKAVVDGFHAWDAGDVTPRLTGRWSFGPAPAASGSYALHVHAHAHRQDGRYANQPWAQEVPDPTTGVVWDSWLEVNPADAKALGVTYNDAVKVKTARGEATVGVFPLPSVAPGTVALALGNGHTAAGRYANNYGVNAASLVEASLDAHGVPTYVTGAEIQKVGDDAKLVTAFSVFGTDDEDRAFGVHVAADKLAEVGDAPAHHPGELTGIHHLELDPRLQEKKATSFYPLPDHPNYRFGLTVDVNACNGCGACSIACYAENNLPIVGKAKVAEGREMGWIRINRYWETAGGVDDVKFVPMMCQQCGHAGCENVCPVLATYHNIDGLNAMVYNRCVGTRYCSNACPFSARKFNYHSYQWPEPFNLQLNPDVSTRTMGVMEKCTFCVQRIRQTKSAYKDGGNFTRTVPDEAWRQVPACVEACPSQALTFGNLNDPEGAVSRSRLSGRTYEPLQELHVLSAVNYLAKANFHDDPAAHHGGGHGGDHAATDHAGDHGDDHADHGEAKKHNSNDHAADPAHAPAAAGDHGDGH